MNDYEYDARCHCGYRWYLRLRTPASDAGARCPKCGNATSDLIPLPPVASR
jgi:hypothetical protein